MRLTKFLSLIQVIIMPCTLYCCFCYLERIILIQNIHFLLNYDLLLISFARQLLNYFQICNKYVFTSISQDSSFSAFRCDEKHFNLVNLIHMSWIRYAFFSFFFAWKFLVYRFFLLLFSFHVIEHKKSITFIIVHYNLITEFISEAYHASVSIERWYN